MKRAILAIAFILSAPLLMGAMVWTLASDLLAGRISQNYGTPCRPCRADGRSEFCALCAGSGWERVGP